ncbi:hypothetical protein SDC9_165710 [bioreactor metagenome]|uniref:Uncharacterized protein n=1 Tax=bioreactor metagenome TaxID=1076179 RepID=A0A645FXH7_9ZZZZ
MISQPEQVVLIILAIHAFAKHSVVGKILKVHCHLTLQQPDKGIPPGKKQYGFDKHDIQRMFFSYMRMFMEDYLRKFLLGMHFGVHKYHPEEREGCQIIFQVINLNTRNKGLTAFQTYSEN